MKDAWKDGIILVILVVFFIIGILGILGLRRSATPAPALEVAIEDVTYTDQDKITISGKTDKNADITAGGEKVNVNDDGTFSFDKTLSTGENKIAIEAKNAGKETTVIEKTVVRQEGGQEVKSAQDGEQAGQPSAGPNDVQELNNSGPVDSLVGIFGIISLIFVTNYYRKSLKATKSSQ